MGLMSLYLFTLLGGLAAGLYILETCFTRTREGERPWLIPLVVVVVFAVALVASATHLQSFSNAAAALSAGTINFGAGMVWEVAAAALFFILALIDMIIVFAKKSSPFALRVATTVVAGLCIILMGSAYINVLGNPVWTNAIATMLTFIAGALALGLGMYAVLADKDYSEKNLKISSLIINAVLALGLAIQISAFAGAGLSVVMPAAGLIVAPIASIAAVLCAAKFGNARTLALIVCVATIIGIALSRYAFYASWTMM